MIAYDVNEVLVKGLIPVFVQQSEIDRINNMKLIYSSDENEYYWEAYNITTHKTDISQSFKTKKEAESSRLQRKLKW